MNSPYPIAPGGGGGASSSAYMMVYLNNSDITCPTGVQTPIIFDTILAQSGGFVLDGSGNIITPVSLGTSRWQVDASIYPGLMSSGTGTMMLCQNGSSILNAVASQASFNSVMELSGLIYLYGGDALSVQFLQTTGSNNNVSHSPLYTYLHMYRIIQ